MPNKKIGGLLLATLFLIFCLTGCKTAKKAAPLPQKPVTLLNPLFISEETFDKSVAEPKDYPAAKNVIAGVVPHHLTAASLIAGFFQSISGCRYDTIVILAPNHHGRVGDIVTSTSDWSTENGVVRCDGAVLPALRHLSFFDLLVDDTTMQNDHSASNMIPYIRYFLPGTRVAPLLLSNRITPDMALALAKTLNQYSKTKRVLVLCSIDFSHYQSADQATKNDSITQAAIQNGDCARVSIMSNPYLDCPSALMTFLDYCKLKAAPVTILDHANSGLLLNRITQSVTSYFILRADT